VPAMDADAAKAAITVPARTPAMDARDQPDGKNAMMTSIVTPTSKIDPRIPTARPMPAYRSRTCGNASRPQLRQRPRPYRSMSMAYPPQRVHLMEPLGLHSIPGAVIDPSCPDRKAVPGD